MHYEISCSSTSTTWIYAANRLARELPKYSTWPGFGCSTGRRRPVPVFRARQIIFPVTRSTASASYPAIRRVRSGRPCSKRCTRSSSVSRSRRPGDRLICTRGPQPQQLHMKWPENGNATRNSPPGARRSVGHDRRAPAAGVRHRDELAELAGRSKAHPVADATASTRDQPRCAGSAPTPGPSPGCSLPQRRLAGTSPQRRLQRQEIPAGRAAGERAGRDQRRWDDDLPHRRHDADRLDELLPVAARAMIIPHHNEHQPLETLERAVRSTTERAGPRGGGVVDCGALGLFLFVEGASAGLDRPHTFRPVTDMLSAAVRLPARLRRRR